MIDGPIGPKWVCAAGVERSTLHRCGLTGLGDGIPFIHQEGPGTNERTFYSNLIERVKKGKGDESPLQVEVSG